MLGHVLHMMCGQPVYISVVDVCFRENEETYGLHSAACVLKNKIDTILQWFGKMSRFALFSTNLKHLRIQSGG